MKKYKANKFRYFRRHIGDRYDGWRVRKVDPVFAVIPYFLRSRLDSQVFFEERISIDNIEAFIKEHKEDIPGLSIMHVIIASMIRVVSQRPNLNRFIMWNKIFARNYLSFSIVIKRSLTDDGEETLIKPNFMPTDTLYDVVRKIQEEYDESLPEGSQNLLDRVSKLFGFFPDFLMRSAVFTLTWLDKIGLLPRTIEQISPWHSSVFLTNIGSIGAESVYHHLYEFGNCSIFMAMGKKSQRHTVLRSGEMKQYKSIMLRFVVDERICDGFYYASSLRMLNRILQNPEQLLTPPEQVIVDDGVKWKRIDQK
ncbi:MAG TPA: 2-oxo acid dehydrogenase subunit E2 [Bacteroidales bacterium]|nr:2-oxo acid dehydrogenase subunit E2 [Bacteroidales bacterium]